MREKGAEGGALNTRRGIYWFDIFLVKSQVTLSITKHIKILLLQRLILRYNLTFTVSLTDWPYSNWVASALLREEEQVSFRAGASVGLSEEKKSSSFFFGGYAWEGVARSLIWESQSETILREINLSGSIVRYHL